MPEESKIKKPSEKSMQEACDMTDGSDLAESNLISIAFALDRAFEEGIECERLHQRLEQLRRVK